MTQEAKKMYHLFKSKTQYFMTHTKYRALQRCNMFLDKAAVTEMAKACRHGKFFCHLGLQSLTCSKIVLLYRGMLIPVIYDKKRHSIITILTMEMLSEEEKSLVYAKPLPDGI